MFFHCVEISVGVEEGVPVLDAEGGDEDIDRSARRSFLWFGDITPADGRLRKLVKGGERLFSRTASNRMRV